MRRHHLGLVLALGACNKPEQTPPLEAAAEPKPVGLQLEAIKAHVEFLAADAQEGRPPGTDADRRVQAYVAKQMKEAGLEPAFGADYRQTFEVIDGVRIRADGKTVLDVGGAAIPHHVVPYTGDTSGSGPAEAKLVYVGFGIQAEDGPGDYAGIERQVKGKIAVVLYGTPDPHIPQTRSRPAVKVIAARDRGAVGVVIWDPTSNVAPHNSGDWNDMQIPVAYVTADGSAQLLAAFGAKAPADPANPGLKKGRVSKKKATLEIDVEPVKLSTANVGGVLPGDGSTQKVLVVGAHMDHLGMGTSSSLTPGERAVHNGADDNASGVAVMLEVCRALSQVPVERRPFDAFCVAFGAEEMGLLGSKYLVDNMDEVARRRIITMVNFDMVGRMREHTVTVAGSGTSSAWAELISANKGDLEVAQTEDGYGPSDHGSFYEAGIPVLHFFTGPHEDYHKPSDDIDKIDFDGAYAVGTMAFGIVKTLEEKKIEPDYVKTQRTRKQGGREFRVSLGTMPDYAGGVDGVKLAGVREGGPAQAAGLQKDDVIKKIGEREIHNLEDYMASFGELAPGKAVNVVVERGGKTLALEMVPAAPRSE